MVCFPLTFKHSKTAADRGHKVLSESLSAETENFGLLCKLKGHQRSSEAYNHLEAIREVSL